MDLGFTRLNELVESLIGEEVQILMTSGDDISGMLKEICADAVILENNGGKLGIVAASCITAILQGPFTSPDDEKGD
jgi:hypothetical protein